MIYKNPARYIQSGLQQRSLRRHCRKGRATKLVFVLASGALLTVSGGAKAQTWDGETSTDWTVGANWDPDATPAPPDTAIIDGTGATNPEILVDSAVTVGGVMLSGGILTVSGGLTSAGVVTVSGTGTLRVNAGTAPNGVITATVDVLTGGTLSLAGVATGSLRVNGGDGNWTAET